MSRQVYQACYLLLFSHYLPALAAASPGTQLSEFVTADRPAAYGWVTMRTHMETTMRNLEAGHGAWDPVTNKSTTAGYQYVDGMDHRVVAK